MRVKLVNTDDTLVAEVELPTGIMGVQIWASVVYKGDVYISTVWPEENGTTFRYISSYTVTEIQ